MGLVKKKLLLIIIVVLLFTTSCNHSMNSHAIETDYLPKHVGTASSGKVKHIEVPTKWQQYYDFEELQNHKGIDVYVPTNLPRGFVLDRVEFQNGIIKGIYINGQKGIVFVQSPATSDIESIELSEDSASVIRWSTAENNFMIIGELVDVSDLEVFKRSLNLLRGRENSISLPFETIQCSEFEEVSNSKYRTSSLYTPLRFQERVGHSCDHKSILDNSIIIGLFAGEKGSSGYTISTANITLQDNQLIVKFSETTPIEGLNYLTVLSSSVCECSITGWESCDICSIYFKSGPSDC